MPQKKGQEKKQLYNKEYDKLHTQMYSFKLNKIHDTDLVEYLNSLGNKQAVIKEALRMYIKKHK